MNHPSLRMWLAAPELRPNLPDPQRFLYVSLGPGTVHDAQGAPHEIPALRSAHPPALLTSIADTVSELLLTLEREQADHERRQEALARLRERQAHAVLADIRERRRPPRDTGMSDGALAQLAVANQALFDARNDAALLLRLRNALERT